eukprot:764414-Hanusia_phi.AAC.1
MSLTPEITMLEKRNVVMPPRTQSGTASTTAASLENVPINTKQIPQAYPEHRPRSTRVRERGDASHLPSCLRTATWRSRHCSETWSWSAWRSASRLANCSARPPAALPAPSARRQARWARLHHSIARFSPRSAPRREFDLGTPRPRLRYLRWIPRML